MAKSKSTKTNVPGAERFITSASGIKVLKKGGTEKNKQAKKNAKGGK